MGKSYENVSMPDYVKNMKSPMRHLYPTENMKKEEMVTSLSKVTTLTGFQSLHSRAADI